MKTLVISIAAIAALSAGYFIWQLFRPLASRPTPAEFACLSEKEGKFQVHEFRPQQIYAVGLAYANHIAETAQNFSPDADPLIFKKDLRTLKAGGGRVDFPRIENLYSAANSLDPTLETKLKEKIAAFDGLVDYEVELGFVLLQDVKDEDLARSDFHPHLGFFIANDLSARSLQILGEGMSNRMEYWGMSKSLTGFLPVTQKIWVPARATQNAIPCVTLETQVNGETRQKEATKNMIYTLRRILMAIRRSHPNEKLGAGDLVIMGTPGGIALTAPRWKGRLADALGLDRFTKLKFVLKGDRSKFLKSGDSVTVSGGWLGSVSVKLE